MYDVARISFKVCERKSIFGEVSLIVVDQGYCCDVCDTSKNQVWIRNFRMVSSLVDKGEEPCR